MCFEVIKGARTGRKFLLIEGIRYSPETEIGDFIAFLDFLSKNGGEEAFLANVTALLKKLKPLSKTNLAKLKYGVRLLQTNYDIYDQFGDVLFRGPTKFMDNFLLYSDIPTITLKRLRLEQAIDDSKESLEKFIFDRDLFQRVTGLDYPDIIERGFGYAPDFNLTDEFIEEYIYLGLRDNANVSIKMSGIYDEDFKRALLSAQIPMSELPTGKFAPAGFVWHHLDDFDFDEEGAAICTMQLVRKELHSKVVQAPPFTGALNQGTEHTGACAIWKRYFDIVGYNY